MPQAIGNQGERLEQIAAPRPAEQRVTANRYAVLRVHARRQTAAALAPERLKIKRVRGEDGYGVAGRCQMPAQASEVSLGAAERGRIALHKVGDAQTIFRFVQDHLAQACLLRYNRFPGRK